MSEGDNEFLSFVSKENDNLFLDLVKQRPCLYDKSLTDYHDKILVENAMEEIAFIMQIVEVALELQLEKNGFILIG